TRRSQALEKQRLADKKASASKKKDVGYKDDEPIPKTPAEREAYFVKQLHNGDELMQKGPEFYPDAAACLFRAVKVHPNPMQIMMMLQQAMPDVVFKMVVELMSSDIDAPREDAGPKITEVDD
ncbi:hypothetical protein HK096_005987, partial [Nowakowskiella sp. JEL0078]